jgi:hypothetical protein
MVINFFHPFLKEISLKPALKLFDIFFGSLIKFGVHFFSPSGWPRSQIGKLMDGVNRKTFIDFVFVVGLQPMRTGFRRRARSEAASKWPCRGRAAGCCGAPATLVSGPNSAMQAFKLNGTNS